MKKTLKIFWLVCLVLLACALVFTACSKGDEPSDENDSDDDSGDDSTDDMNDETELHVHETTEWKVITQATPYAPGRGVWICTECGAEVSTETFMLDPENQYYIDNCGYYSGYYNGHDVIIGANGNIVYSCKDYEELLLYANGYFLSEKDGIQYLKKANGTIVCSTESLGITGFGLDDNYVDYISFLADGYVFAYKVNETYYGVTYEIGILGTDGKWIVPLSDENPILNSGMPCSVSAFHKDLRYLEEGVLLLKVQLSDYYYNYVIYNISDNEVYRLNANYRSSNLNYMITTAKFENEVFCGIRGDNMYEIHSDGTVNIKNLFPDDALNFGTYGFYVDDNGDYTVLSNNGREMELRKNGLLIKVFDTVNITNAVYVGDMWLIFIKNQAGNFYYTYLKPDGEFLFEPIDSDASYICTQEGIGISYYETDIVQGYTKIVVDRNGNTLYTSKKGTTEIFVRNGVVHEIEEGVFGTIYFEEFTHLAK